jgi:DNA primase
MKIINLKPGLITDVMDYLGIEIINKNRLRCPFHDDKNPSAILSLEANTFKCFACGITLTSKQFFKKYLEENLGYSEETAEEKWQEFLSLILNSEYSEIINKNKSKNDKNKSKKESYINIADKLWNLIANCSIKFPYDIEVIEYLKKRKLPRQLLSDKIISILPTLDEKVLSKIDPEFKNYYKFLTAAHQKGYKIAIPQKDENNQIINIQLRNVDRSIKPKTLSLKNHKTGNFIFEPKDKNNIEKNKIIITEGSADFLQAITVSNFKYYVYGMYSATAKADPLINFIKNKNINKIILIPHKDPEGIKMKNEITKKIKEAHEKKEIKIEKIITIDIKNYKDLAELIESKEEERKNISKAINQA